MSDCVPDTFTVHFHARIIKESRDLSSEKDQVGGQVGSVKEGGEPAGECECRCEPSNGTPKGQQLQCLH